MPGTILGFPLGTGTAVKRTDRWLSFQYAFPPERDIRDREDSPGARNSYNLWGDGDCIGDEITGVSVQKVKVYDDDIRFAGTKAFSYRIAGQCLDSVGAPVPGATVELWQSFPDWPDAHQPLLIATIVADSDGMYGFAVPNNVTKYYIVAYISSKGGVTVRNLVGA